MQNNKRKEKIKRIGAIVKKKEKQAIRKEGKRSKKKN